jgi:hypothetical protein
VADVVCVVDGCGIAGILEVRDLPVRLVSAVRGINAAHPVTNLVEITFGMTWSKRKCSGVDS